MKILCSVYIRTDRHIMAGKLRLTAFDNPEKRNHTDARMGGILPSFPARHGLFGRPGVGKGSVTQNLLGRGDFDTFCVVHWDKNAPEWVNLLDDQPEFRMMGFREDGFPAAEDFDPKKRNGLVLDEIPWDCYLWRKRAMPRESSTTLRHIVPFQSLFWPRICSQFLFL